MKNIILFLCSGRAKRMNGEIKALCEVLPGITIIQNNLDICNSLYDEKIIVSNFENYEKFKEKKFKNVDYVNIQTGNGDADSLRRALKKLEGKYDKLENLVVTVVWGDTLFLSKKPFEKILNFRINANELIVGCSFDDNPYVYFDYESVKGHINGGILLHSYFANTESSIDRGLHDQSIFRMSYKSLLFWLDKYAEDFFRYSSSELKFIKLIDFMSSHNCCAKICYMENNLTKSFNTFEELKELQQFVEQN